MKPKYFVCLSLLFLCLQFGSLVSTELPLISEQVVHKGLDGRKRKIGFHSELLGTD